MPAIEIKENVPLAQYTTFKIGGPARYYCSVSNEDDLIEACRFARERNVPVFILGGGSNILVSDKGFGGLVIRMRMKGVYFHENGDGTVTVSSAAGELWDDLVERTVGAGLYGIENLSAIPGTVGAAPVQNIGAYGCDASATIVKVRAYDAQADRFVEMDNGECRFGYRDSVFKHDKRRHIITQVDFRLRRNGKVDISYQDLSGYFAEKGIANPTLRQVREAVIDVRWNKLPDWKLWGTGGSFFKNPVISSEHFADLKVKYPDLPGYREPDGRVKVSLGWILDKLCDAKGVCKGNACVYEKQALVLIAKPGARAEELVSLAHDLMHRVKDKTGIDVEGEVEWVN